MEINGRCNRCGTMIRNNRPACPSCGTDMTPENLLPMQSVEAVAHTERRIKNTSDMKLCSMCMGSFPAEEFQEVNGQELCGTCGEQMSAKAIKAEAESMVDPQPTDGEKA